MATELEEMTREVIGYATLQNGAGMITDSQLKGMNVLIETSLPSNKMNNLNYIMFALNENFAIHLDKSIRKRTGLVLP